MGSIRANRESAGGAEKARPAVRFGSDPPYVLHLVPGSRLGRRVPGREVDYLPDESQTPVSRHGAGAAEARGANTETLMAARPRPRSRFLPAVEGLEDRLVPTVTYHGGALLPHVEVQGMYLGSDWYNNGTYYNQTAQFEAFNRFLPQSSYMDLLTQLGYGVGRGSTSPGTIDRLAINKNYYLTDSTIRGEVQRFINARYLQQPDANRLYVVYVEPGVAILDDHGGNATSIRDFAGYHSAFAGRTAAGYAADIHYAVMAYAGGINPVFPGLTPFGSMTLTASHEIAEAATDPNVGYRAAGWYDDYNNGEIGDINRYEASLNGYVVQSIINKYDVAYIPSGATTLRALDTISGRGFAGLAGHTPAADARLRLPSHGGGGSAGPGGQSHEVDTLFALLANSHSTGRAEEPAAADPPFGPAAAHDAKHGGPSCRGLLT
jgi:hypothetical protein